MDYTRTDNMGRSMDNREPIRVLQIVGRMDRGGIENFIMNVYRNIDREKVQFDFLAHYGKEAAFNDEIRAMGGRIYEMPAIRDESHVYYWRLFKYRSSLKRFFKEHHEYKIVHGQMTNTASLYMPIAKRNGVTTLIAHSHNSHGKVGLLGFVTNVLKKPVIRYATDLFACSESAARYFFPQKVVDSGKVKVVHNAIDAEKFRYNKSERARMRAELGIDNNLVIGCVGRFRTEKNQSFLLEVLKEAIKIAPNVVLMFVGDGPLENEVKTKSVEMGIDDRCVFLGMRSDVSSLMQAMDVLAMPSLFEGLPVTGIEAQASGLKVVASTGVPVEMNAIDMVSFIDLKEGSKSWAEELVKCASVSRMDAFELIREAGYDIHTMVPWLQEFYILHG